MAADLSEADRQTVVDGLVRYNAEQGYIWERKPLHVLARAADGSVVGGLLGEVNLGWLFIAALWVDESSRGSGVGTALMQEAEAEARRRGCTGIFLDTYSCQARPFYEGLGFSVFGELRDCPAGEIRYYLSKLLAPPAAMNPVPAP